MMSPAERESPLDEILAAYLESVEAGNPVDRTEILMRHAEWAGPLAEFFADQDRFASFMGPIHAATTRSEFREAYSLCSSRVAVIPAIGERFGDYELLEEIGRGGMGVVFKARQSSLSRTVALKMILTGQLASPAEVERFRLEAEAAARLDDPNIVPIYEVGAENGFHYYTMKFVDGGNLAEWHHSRPRRARDEKAMARLLATVADAVHHAHQRGVLHRDLKPANILVDAAGQPHVADFGLARRLSSDGSPCTPTPYGATIGTPSYMAPEQALGPNKVTTAADVYSLGCILYELLTDQPPFRAETPFATLLEVLERSPRKPSELRPSLDRDLETITLKCVEKDPARRYASAGELADELRRFASGEPIRARPANRLERMRRWCRKEPLLAGAVAAIAAVGLMGFALVTWQWRRAEENYRISKHHEEWARREKDKGERQLVLSEERFDDAHALVDAFCLRLSEDRLSYLPGTQQIRKELLEAACRYYRKFLTQKEQDRRLRGKLAKTHYSLGSVLVSLGDSNKALEHYHTALGLYDELMRGTPPSGLELQRARILHDVALIHSQAGRWEKALEAFGQARTVFEDATANAPNDLKLQTDLAGVLGNTGNLFRAQGKLKESHVYLERALSIRRRAAEREPDNDFLQAALATTYLNYGNLLMSLNIGKECLDCYRRNREINEKLVKRRPGDAVIQRNLAQILKLIGEHERQNGAPTAARKTLTESRERLEQLMRTNPGVVEIERELAATYRQLAHLSASTKKDEALLWNRKGVSLLEKALARQGDAPEVANDLAKCWFDMGTVLADVPGRGKEALHAFEQSYRLREQVVRACPNRLNYRHDLAYSLGNLGVTLWNHGRKKEGLAAAERALEETRRLLVIAPEVDAYRRSCSAGYHRLSQMLWKSGRTPECLADVRRRAELWPADGKELFETARDLGKLLSEKGPSASATAEQRATAELLVLEVLRRAIATGYPDRQTLVRESAFSALHERPEFQALLTAALEKQ
jgi:serine/threonine-protein kinase